MKIVILSLTLILLSFGCTENNTNSNIRVYRKSISSLSKSIDENRDVISNLLVKRGIEKFIKKDYDGSVDDFNEALQYKREVTSIYKLIIISKMWQKFKKNDTWLQFEKQDIANIIDEVYPSNITKPTVDEII
ncbi:MAG: hypothetical protein V3V16_09720 [Melioribacteraceae bacterium]